MRIFQNKAFARFARKSRLANSDFCKLVEDATNGLIDADLDSGVIKQRFARKGGGKSGGFRTIILFRVGMRAFSVHGFVKNETDNIDDDELAAFKSLAAQLQSYSDAALTKAVANGTFTVVMRDGEAAPQPSDGLDP